MKIENVKKYGKSVQSEEKMKFKFVEINVSVIHLFSGLMLSDESPHSPSLVHLFTQLKF